MLTDPIGPYQQCLVINRARTVHRAYGRHITWICGEVHYFRCPAHNCSGLPIMYQLDMHFDKQPAIQKFGLGRKSKDLATSAANVQGGGSNHNRRIKYYLSLWQGLGQDRRLDAASRKLKTTAIRGQSKYVGAPVSCHVHVSCQLTPACRRNARSWLNQVERWFGKITEQRIRRRVFQAVKELEAAILDYIENHNAEPKPFIWTATADMIFAKLTRTYTHNFCVTTLDLCFEQI